MCRRFILIPYTLFFTLLFVPLAYQPIKAALLALVLGVVVIETFLRGRVALHPGVLLWTLLMVVVGLWSVLLGWINGGPGALRSGSVFVLWPIVYTILVAGAARKEVIEGLSKVVVLATFAIGLYSLSFIFHRNGWLPDPLYIELNQGQAIGFSRGEVAFRLHSLNSLFFTMPFVLTLILAWPRSLALPISRFWIWSAFMLGFVAVLLSGRRALWLVVGLTPALAFFFRLFLASKRISLSRKRFGALLMGAPILIIGSVAVLQFVFGFGFTDLAERFLAGWDFASDAGASVRREQFSALLDGWAERPVFGTGHGTVATYVRSDETPWTYELSYVSLLFHTGIVGFSIYAAGVLWIFWMGSKVIRTRDRLGAHMLPVLVGMAGFLIGSATNPYILTFDYVWTVFLPIALINSWLLTNKRNAVPSLDTGLPAPEAL